MLYLSLYQSLSIATEQTALLQILFSVISVIALTTVASWVSSWMRPHRPNVAKLTTYESGMEPIGNVWGAVDTRLYVIGLVFILFELETILLFPWATVWIEDKTQQATNSIWDLYMAITGTFFILVLAIGLAYVIIKGRVIFGDITSSSQRLVPSNYKIPLSYYERINAQYANFNPTINKSINE